MTRLVIMAAGDRFSLWSAAGSAGGQVLLMLGIVLIIAFGFVIWAAIWRTPRKRRHTYHHGSASDDSANGLPPRRKRRSGLSRALFRRKRHKRSHHHHRERPVNPTLSQVGGLPPRRDDNEPTS